MDAGASSDDDIYNNAVISIIGGTGVGQSRLINNYTGSSKTCAVINVWATTPDSTSVFVIRHGAADVERWRANAINVPISNDLQVNVQVMAANVMDDAAVATDLDTYQAKVWIIDDDAGGNDRYMFTFFKNGKQITAGVTVPTVWVYTAAAAPADLIGTSGAPQALTEAG
ncbi:MAG: hypothetical protein IIC57_11135, partial [Proteobacteria bacterium]|nr:hypothetical protein [Pseudomonadota bacterium]